MYTTGSNISRGNERLRALSVNSIVTNLKVLPPLSSSSKDFPGNLNNTDAAGSSRFELNSETQSADAQLSSAFSLLPPTVGRQSAYQIAHGSRLATVELDCNVQSSNCLKSGVGSSYSDNIEHQTPAKMGTGNSLIDNHDSKTTQCLTYSVDPMQQQMQHHHHQNSRSPNRRVSLPVGGANCGLAQGQGLSPKTQVKTV